MKTTLSGKLRSAVIKMKYLCKKAVIMPSIEIKPAIKVGMEEILDGISNLDTPDLEVFLQEVAHLLAKRKTKTLPKRESELLLKINESMLTADEQTLYDQLYERLQAENITEEEHHQLMELIQRRERRGVEKLTYVVELSQLRKVSLKDLMDNLGISALSDG